MNERDFWQRHVRPALHAPPFRIAKKIQDAFVKGQSDMEYCLGGATGKIEMKYIPKRPAKPITPIHIEVSTEQRSHLREWHNAGGNAFVLVGVEHQWYLLKWDVPLHIREQDLGPWVVTSGDLKNIDRLLDVLSGLTQSPHVRL